MNFAFKHLGAVLQLVLTAKDGEINVKQIDITADQGLSGAFTVTDGQAVITNSGTSITTGDISSQNIKLTATATYLNFAIPAGDFTNYRIIVTDTNNNTYSLTAPSLSIQKAMVNKLPAALNAGVLFVNGHKVKVKLADDVATHDILIETYADGNTVKIDAFSKSGKGLSCGITGTAACNKAKTDNFYTFTISDVTSDITAKIGYQLVESISLNKTSVNIPQGLVSHILTATSFPEDAANKAVNWSSEPTSIATVDANGTVTAVAQGEATITATAADGSGVTATCTVNVVPQDGSLSHEFSISATKKVHFSKGNLYFKRTSSETSDWAPHFYDEQYQYNSLSAGEFRASTSNDTEIDLFTWGYNWEYTINPIGLNHVGGHTEEHNKNLDENDDWGSQIGDGSTWRTLTTAEWQYLFNTRINASSLYKSGVTVCGKTNCVVLLPDDWTWDSITVGTGWQTEYNETTTTAVKWSTMEAAGAVCLPAAGHRYDNNVYDVGKYGYYWSSSAIDGNSASVVSFGGFGVPNPDTNNGRSGGCGVRLITEIK